MGFLRRMRRDGSESQKTRELERNGRAVDAMHEALR